MIPPTVNPLQRRGTTWRQLNNRNTKSANNKQVEDNEELPAEQVKENLMFQQKNRKLKGGSTTLPFLFDRVHDGFLQLFYCKKKTTPSKQMKAENWIRMSGHLAELLEKERWKMKNSVQCCHFFSEYTWINYRIWLIAPDLDAPQQQGPLDFQISFWTLKCGGGKKEAVFKRSGAYHWKKYRRIPYYS